MYAHITHIRGDMLIGQEVYVYACGGVGIEKKKKPWLTKPFRMIDYCVQYVSYY